MKKLFIVLVLVLSTNSVQAQSKNIFRQILEETAKKVLEGEAYEQAGQATEKATGVSEIPTSPGQIVNRTMTGKREPSVHIDWAKPYWIEDYRHMLRQSMGIDYQALNVPYNPDERLYDTQEGDALHLRFGGSVRSEFGWATTHGHATCDYAYLYYANTQLPQAVRDTCILNERENITKMFGHLNDAQNLLLGAPPNSVNWQGAGNRVGAISELGAMGTASQPNFNLSAYAKDGLDPSTPQGMDAIRQKYGRVVDDRFEHIRATNRFFVVINRKNSYYDPNTQKARFLFHLGHPILGRGNNAEHLVGLTASDLQQTDQRFRTDEYSYSLGAQEFIIQLPMTQTEFGQTTNGYQGEAYYVLYFTVKNRIERNSKARVVDVNIERLTIYSVPPGLRADRAKNPFVATSYTF